MVDGSGCWVGPVGANGCWTKISEQWVRLDDHGMRKEWGGFCVLSPASLLQLVILRRCLPRMSSMHPAPPLNEHQARVSLLGITFMYSNVTHHWNKLLFHNNTQEDTLWQCYYLLFNEAKVEQKLYSFSFTSSLHNICTELSGSAFPEIFPSCCRLSQVLVLFGSSCCVVNFIIRYLTI